MATNFPTTLDSLTNPSSGQTLNSPSHSGQHPRRMATQYSTTYRNTLGEE